MLVCTAGAAAAASTTGWHPPHALPAGPEAPHPWHEPVAGVRELSGFLIVRPLSADHRIARGEAPAAARAASERLVAELAPLTERWIEATGELIVRVPDGRGDLEFAAELRAGGGVAYAEPDWICYPAGEPNDPHYPLQWHHAMIGSPSAWELATDAGNIVCAIVDSGIENTHPELAPILVPGYNVVDDLPEVEGGDTRDVHGHGTCVAGCAAAVGNNALGITGIGWRLPLMPVRATNTWTGAARTSDLLLGARWAAENGAKVVNISYTGITHESVGPTGEYVRSLGAILCFATGNDGQELATFDYPGVTVVGATDAQDNRPGWSGHGRAVDLYAPGDAILTTSRGATYALVNGTSFASPIVAGSMALIWSLEPAMTADRLEAIVLNTCVDRGPPGDDEEWGHGRLDLARAAAAVACPVDANGDGTLSLADWVVFRDWMTAGDARADLDNNGALTMNDFVAFRNRFVAGCR